MKNRILTRLALSALLVVTTGFSVKAAESERPKGAENPSENYGFRNQLFIDAADLEKPWRMEEGVFGQDVIGTFWLEEENVERALVGLVRMDDIFSDPDRMKDVVLDMKKAMERVDPESKVTITENVKVKLKSGEEDTIRLDFSKPIDGKKVCLYLFCLPLENDKDKYAAYAFQVGLQEDKYSSDVGALLAAMRLTPVKAEEK